MARTTRPSALGDLRLAGSVATGLVAGTLGLGALAAPLVGWRDWPSALQSAPSAGNYQLAKPQAATQRPGKPGPKGGASKAPAAKPGSATAIGGFTPATALPAGGPAAGGAISIGPAGLTVTPRPQHSSAQTQSSASTGDKGATFSGAQFTAPTDTDQDNIPDDYENANNLNASNAGDASLPDDNGITNRTAFMIRSTIANPDTNGNGVIDGADDSDGDGISNADEELLGTDAWNADTDGNGVPDGQDDFDHNGVPDGTQFQTTPVDTTEPTDTTQPVDTTEPTDTTQPVDTTPPVDTSTPPGQDGTGTPPVTDTPAKAA